MKLSIFTKPSFAAIRSPNDWTSALVAQFMGVYTASTVLGWIDFNRDGKFQVGEAKSTIDPTNLAIAVGGEVEDYAVIVTHTNVDYGDAPVSFDMLAKN